MTYNTVASARKSSTCASSAFRPWSRQQNHQASTTLNHTNAAESLEFPCFTITFLNPRRAVIVLSIMDNE